MALIRRKPDLRKTRDKTGFVYVAHATHNGKPLVKVGYTAGDTVDARLQQVRSTCPGLDVRTLPGDPPHQRVRAYYKRVETLAHQDLRHARHDITDCACGRQHREYFAVDPAVAYDAVGRWIRFCKEQPWYDDDDNNDNDNDNEKAGDDSAGNPNPFSRAGGAGKGADALKPEWAERLEPYCSSPPRGGGPCPTAWAGRFVAADEWAWFWYDARRVLVSETCLALAAILIVWLAWHRAWLALVGRMVLVVWPARTLLRVHGFRWVMAERAFRGWFGRGAALAGEVVANCALMLGLGILMTLAG